MFATKIINVVFSQERNMDRLVLATDFLDVKNYSYHCMELFISIKHLKRGRLN